MKYNVYAIKDNKVGFGNLFLDQSDISAVRGFGYAINGKEGLMNFSPSDFDLYRIGKYDTENGVIEKENPIMLVVSGSSVVMEK